MSYKFLIDMILRVHNKLTKVLNPSVFFHEIHLMIVCAHADLIKIPGVTGKCHTIHVTRWVCRDVTLGIIVCPKELRM